MADKQGDDLKHVKGSDIICLEGNGCRPSHKGIGWSGGVCDVYTQWNGSTLRMLSGHMSRTHGRAKTPAPAYTNRK